MSSDFSNNETNVKKYDGSMQVLRKHLEDESRYLLKDGDFWEEVEFANNDIRMNPIFKNAELELANEQDYNNWLNGIETEQKEQERKYPNEQQDEEEEEVIGDLNESETDEEEGEEEEEEEEIGDLNDSEKGEEEEVIGYLSESEEDLSNSEPVVTPVKQKKPNLRKNKKRCKVGEGFMKDNNPPSCSSKHPKEPVIKEKKRPKQKPGKTTKGSGGHLLPDGNGLEIELKNDPGLIWVQTLNADKNKLQIRGMKYKRQGPKANPSQKKKSKEYKGEQLAVLNHGINVESELELNKKYIFFARRNDDKSGKVTVYYIQRQVGSRVGRRQSKATFKRGKKASSEDKPKRALTKYQKFVQDYRANNPEAGGKDFFKKVSKAWKKKKNEDAGEPPTDEDDDEGPILIPVVAPKPSRSEKTYVRKYAMLTPKEIEVAGSEEFCNRRRLVGEDQYDSEFVQGFMNGEMMNQVGIPDVIKYLDGKSGELTAFAAYVVRSITAKKTKNRPAMNSIAALIDLVCTRNNRKYGRPKWKDIENDILKKIDLKRNQRHKNRIILLKADEGGSEEATWKNLGFKEAESRIFNDRNKSSIGKTKPTRESGIVWLMKEFN